MEWRVGKRQDWNKDKLNGSGMRIAEDEQEKRSVIFPSPESRCERKENDRVAALLRARLLGETGRWKRRKKYKKQIFKIQEWMLKLHSEGFRSRQGGTDGWFWGDIRGNLTLLVTVEKGWIFQRVWKLIEDKAIWLNGLIFLFFFSHIQGKGADLGTETVIRRLRITTEWAATSEHMVGRGVLSWGKDPWNVTAPISTIIWLPQERLGVWKEKQSERYWVDLELGSGRARVEAREVRVWGV